MLGCLHSLCLCKGCRVEVILGRAAGVAAAFSRLCLPSQAEQIVPYSKQRARWVKAEMGRTLWMEGGNLPLGQCCWPQATLFFCMSETFCMDPYSCNSGDRPAHGEPVCFELKPLYRFQSIFT